MAFYKTDGFEIPDYMAGQIVGYVERGEEPGDFIKAVIRNDLKGAVEHADSTNLVNIVAFVKYFYNRTPASCWGSQALLLGWIQSGGKQGLDI